MPLRRLRSRGSSRDYRCWPLCMGWKSLPMNLSASGSMRSWYRFLASASNLWVLKIRVGWAKGEGGVGRVRGDEVKGMEVKKLLVG